MPVKEREEAMSSMNDDADYEHLYEILFNDAVGDSEAVVESETLVRKTDDGEIRQTRSRKRPNVAMAAKLIADRIGGPQDFC